MKKIILLVLILLVCGCSKKLTCAHETVYEDVKISNKITFNFKENTYSEEDIMVFSSDMDALNYYNDIEEYIEEYNLVLDKNKIISKLNGEIKLDSTKEKIKEQYKNYGYKCN